MSPPSRFFIESWTPRTTNPTQSCPRNDAAVSLPVCYITITKRASKGLRRTKQRCRPLPRFRFKTLLKSYTDGQRPSLPRMIRIRAGTALPDCRRWGSERHKDGQRPSLRDDSDSGGDGASRAAITGSAPNVAAMPSYTPRSVATLMIPPIAVLPAAPRDDREPLKAVFRLSWLSR